MSNITAIHRAVEFIEQNLREEIAIADIADAAFYSLFHFCRMFNAITHLTPYDYLMRRRLSESARELLETDQKIIEIAFDYQFNSPEVFARAFKRMFGMQPNQWRKQGMLSKRMLMPKLSLAYLHHINTGAYLRPVLEEKAAWHVAGFASLITDDNSVISTLWEMLAQAAAHLDVRVDPPQYYGILAYPNDRETCGAFYMAAIQVAAPISNNPLLVVKTLPASQYACFIHNGSSQHLPLTRDYIYHTWLPKSGKRQAFPLEIESYGWHLPTGDAEISEQVLAIPLAEIVEETTNRLVHHSDSRRV